MIKKISITAVLVLLAAIAAGCAGAGSRKEAATETVSQEMVSETTSPVTQEAPEIENEKPVRLYEMDYSADTARLVKDYYTDWDPDHDIAVFGAFNTDESEIYFNTEKEAHLRYWNSVETAADYKIGYEISFEVGGEKRVITILGPEDVEKSDDLFMGDVDTEEVTGYLGVWLYDDVNQEDGAWYSHILPEEVDEDTLLTSVKLRATPKSKEIENVILKAFSYSSALEFNEAKQYNNNYGYEIRILND